MAVVDMANDLKENVKPEIQKISVVIPTFNRRHLLADTLESVFSQTYPIHEIIVVDDGSSDRTAEFLKQYGTRLRVISQLNQGPSVARNRGMFEATGDFIAFLDSDDVWMPTKTAQQQDFFERYPHLDLTFGDIVVVKNGQESGSEIKEAPLRNALVENASDLQEMFTYLVAYNFTITSTLMFRKTCADAVGNFDVTLRLCEDLDFWLRAVRRHRFGFVNSILASRRRHDSNLVNDWLKRETAHVQVLARLLEIDADTAPEERGLIKARLDDLSYDIGSFHFKNGEFADAHAWFKRCSPGSGTRRGKRLIKEASSLFLGRVLRQKSLTKGAMAQHSQRQPQPTS